MENAHKPNHRTAKHPKGILKSTKTLEILPNSNPSVAPKRNVRVQHNGKTLRRKKETKNKKDAQTIPREELIQILSKNLKRIKPTTKASTELLRDIYENAKMSGLI